MSNTLILSLLLVIILSWTDLFFQVLFGSDPDKKISMLTNMVFYFICSFLLMRYLEI